MRSLPWLAVPLLALGDRPAQTAAPGGLPAIELPHRTTGPAAPAGPPELRAGSPTITRVHATASDQREWLFEQNSVDPLRVTGFQVVHAAQTIVVYEDSDLRNWLGLRGWADVIAMGDSGGLRRSADPLTLRHPTLRFPRYRVVDLAEWLERPRRD